MKIAVVLIPKSGEVTMLLNNSHRPPSYFILGRGPELTVLSMLLLCALALVIWNYSPAFQSGASALSAPNAAEAQFVCAVPARTLARSFDGSRPLKAGDAVVVNGETGPMLHQIAAAPHETLALREGNFLKALYVVGDSSCVVVSNQQFSTMRSDGIRASFAGAAGF